MKILNANIEPYYEIVITDDYSLLPAKLSAILDINSKLLIITDSNVKKIYLNILVNILNKVYTKIYFFVVKAGEQSKSIMSVLQIYNFCIKQEISKTDCILSLGGGVTGDLAGFVAATYKRGIKFVQLPTSLLAQVDSSVGGKVGISYGNIKNIVGSIYQPCLVYIATCTLKTLHKRQVNNAMAEVIVHSCISDGKLLDFLNDNYYEINNIDNKTMENLIYWNCKIKMSIVERDPFDRNVRKLLNFGHTFGHAIEVLSNYELLHGECVAIGVATAYRIAEKVGMVGQNEMRRIEEILLKFDLPILADKARYEYADIVNKIYQDKKVCNGKLNILLPTRIGNIKILEVFPEDIRQDLYEKALFNEGR